VVRARFVSVAIPTTLGLLLGVPHAWRDAGGQEAPAAPAGDARVAVGSPVCGGTSKAARCHLQLDAPGAERRDHYSGIAGQFRFRELATWREHGGHARSYERLTGERGRIMADQLAYWESGQKEPTDSRRKDPTKREDCLSCHALVTGPPSDPARAFEGVSCESCHGNAGSGKDKDGKPLEGWIDAHMQEGWRQRGKEAWASHGMAYTPELRSWAKRCLDCHMGGTGAGESYRLTHALYAAGHPPLSFELVTDLALAPHHFRERVGNEVVPGELVPWFYARLWSVGQAVTLAESMRRLERAFQEPALDLAFMECFSCHHALDTTLAQRRLAGWRQSARGFFGAPGEPALALESWMVARHVAKRLLPKEKLEKLVKDVETVFYAASLRSVHQREKARAAATSAAAIADEVTALAEAEARFDPGSASSHAKHALGLLRELASDNEVPYYGFRAAEQQARAFYVLYLVALGRSDYRPANDDRIRARLDELFGLLYTAKREPKPGEFDLVAYQAAREALARELPGEVRKN
jgi:hypothetical protein